MDREFPATGQSDCEPSASPDRHQDGDRHRENHRDGDADYLANAEQDRIPARRTFLGFVSHRDAGNYHPRPPARSVPSNSTTCYKDLNFLPNEKLPELGKAKILITNYQIGRAWGTQRVEL